MSILVTLVDTRLEGRAAYLWIGGHMGSINATTIEGPLAPLGVLTSNSRSHSVMKTKIDELTKHAEMHSCMVERIFQLEQGKAIVKQDIEVPSEKTVPFGLGKTKPAWAKRRIETATSLSAQASFAIPSE